MQSFLPSISFRFRFSSSIALWIPSYAVLNLLFNILPWTKTLRPVSPALIVYALQNAILPALASPFLVTSYATAASRIAQIAWLISRPPDQWTQPSFLAMSYAVLLAVRSTSGFLLSRSVGWAYPKLFSHTALYEPVVGIGPLLVGALLFEKSDVQQSRRGNLMRFGFLAGFTLLDGAPWSYTCGTLWTGAYCLLQTSREHREWSTSTYNLLPVTAPSVQTNHAEPSSTLSTNLPRARIVFYLVLSVLISSTGGNVHRVYANSTRSARVDTASSPPLHIMMLTVPRTRNLTSDVMIEALTSYDDPWAAHLASGAPLDARLTVYAHLGADGTHPALERAKTYFAHSSIPLTFYTAVPNAERGWAPNHYVHLADAVQYAHENGKQGEWTMFVEDDFVLCGRWGWDNLWHVMTTLRTDVRDPYAHSLNGAFIGTGGSGLIFPHSSLPTLYRLLLLVASFEREGTAVRYALIPPDVLLQQCLTGEQPLCSADGWVISSRMIMGHRGWDLSTGERTYEEGKWACGWRHPMHGMKGAVVVDT